MAKYIDVSQLYKCETCVHHTRCGCNTWCENGEAYRPAMSKLKIADVVEVVRCKDCEHSYFIKSCSKYECRKDGGVLKYSTDFCSYGKRRTNDTIQKIND